MARKKKKKKKKQQEQVEVQQTEAVEVESGEPEQDTPPVERAESEDCGAEEAAKELEAEAPEAEEPEAEEPEAEEPEAEEPASEGTKADDGVQEERAQDVEQGRTDQDTERRRRYRLNKVLGATLTGSDGEANKARLFVIDISATGFRATDHTPHSEAEYFIEIILNKGDEPFKSKMRVVWSKELTVSGMFQMGCEFIETTEEEKDRLEAFIAGERSKLENAPAKPIDLGRPWTMIK